MLYSVKLARNETDIHFHLDEFEQKFFEISEEMLNKGD